MQIHDDHLLLSEPDKNWIPNVTARGWVILNKDKNIRRPPGEREDVLLAGAKVFTLASGNMRGVDMAAVFIQYLSEVERIASTQTPPFVYVVGPDIIQQILPRPTPPQENQSDEEETPGES